MGLPVAKGDIIAGKFEVQRILGTGGCGVVVAARHLGLGETVAIKLLQKSAMRSPETVERFSREARAAARVRSEHVARVNDFGTTETGIPYMVMECLDGEDLGATLAREGRVAVQDAIDYVLMACDAVAEAHALGIVHRDLKPANLFLTRAPDGRAVVKVLDFGISKLLDAGSWEVGASVTQTQAVIGSPLYMSPEQMEASRDVDARADVWALGTILYQLIAGAPPYEAPTVPLLYVKVLSGERPTPLDQRREEVPADVSAAVDRCLAREPGGRFPTVGHLALALAPHASAEVAPLAERIARLAGAEASPTPGSPMLGEGPPSGIRRRSLPSLGEEPASSRRLASVAPAAAAPRRTGLLVVLSAVALLGSAFGVYGVTVERRVATVAVGRSALRVAAASSLVARGAKAQLAAEEQREAPPGPAVEAQLPAAQLPVAEPLQEGASLAQSPLPSRSGGGAAGPGKRAPGKPSRPSASDVLDER